MQNGTNGLSLASHTCFRMVPSIIPVHSDSAGYFTLVGGRGHHNVLSTTAWPSTPETAQRTVKDNAAGDVQIKHVKFIPSEDAFKMRENTGCWHGRPNKLATFLRTGASTTPTENSCLAAVFHRSIFGGSMEPSLRDSPTAMNQMRGWWQGYLATQKQKLDKFPVTLETSKVGPEQ